MVQLQDHPAIGGHLMHRTGDPREARDEGIIIRSHEMRRRERFGVHAGDARDDQADAPLCQIAVKVTRKSDTAPSLVAAFSNVADRTRRFLISSGPIRPGLNTMESFLFTVHLLLPVFATSLGIYPIYTRAPSQTQKGD
jgi:hypothetical protein